MRILYIALFLAINLISQAAFAQQKPISSVSQLNAYLKETSGKSSPLDRFSSEGKAQFLNGLRFNNNGLVGLDYSSMLAELNAEQAYKVLALFGAGRVLPLIKGIRIQTPEDKHSMSLATPMMRVDDHDSYRCDSPHTCAYAPQKICMSGC